MDDSTAIGAVVGVVSGLSSAVAGAAALVRLVVRPAITELRAEFASQIGAVGGRVDAAEVAIAAANRDTQNAQNRLDGYHERLRDHDTWRAGIDVRLEGVADGIGRTEKALDRLRDRST